MLLFGVLLGVLLANVALWCEIGWDHLPNWCIVLQYVLIVYFGMRYVSVGNRALASHSRV